MSWTFTYQPSFVADLKQLDHQAAVRILEKLDELRENPTRSMKRLKGSDLFRFRVGDYRMFARAHIAQKWLDFV